MIDKLRMQVGAMGLYVSGTTYGIGSEGSSHRSCGWFEERGYQIEVLKHLFWNFEIPDSPKTSKTNFDSRFSPPISKFQIEVSPCTKF